MSWFLSCASRFLSWALSVWAAGVVMQRDGVSGFFALGSRTYQTDILRVFAAEATVITADDNARHQSITAFRFFRGVPPRCQHGGQCSY